MPKICYDTEALRRLQKNAGRMAIIQKANEIIANYQGQGYDLTLRQLYYQFVARDILPNKQSEYKKLGDVLLEGRMAGLIDWSAIVDRTRNLKSLPHWESPSDIVQACSTQFRVDLWEGQPFRVEVWIEKDALVGVIERVCQRFDVPFFSCRGYTSVSEIWGAAQRLKKYRRGTKKGQTPVILHFGDHDPSGIDMTRDITDRMATFGMPLEVRRLALNFDQVQEYNPPPNFAKETDSRHAGYLQRFGDESWELDALEPSVLEALIQEEVEGLIEPKAWATQKARQREARAELQAVSENWEEVRGICDDNGWIDLKAANEEDDEENES